MNKAHHDAPMSDRMFAMFGGGEVAYIKVISSEEARALYQEVSDIPDGIKLYALQAADGTPIALTDSWDTAFGHAIEDELKVVSVH